MRTRRPWLLISSIATTLLGITAVMLWWYLPVAAPVFVLRHAPVGNPGERAVVALVGLIADGRKDLEGLPWSLVSTGRRPLVAAGLMRALRSERVETRVAAMELVSRDLQRHPAGGGPQFGIDHGFIASCLDDADVRVRLAAIVGLRGTWHDSGIDPEQLKKAAHDQDPRVRVEVIRYVRSKQVPAVAALMLDDAVPLIREMAVDTVGRSKDPSWIPPLVHLFDDPEPRVRIAAAKALGELEDERALPGLIAGLRAADPAVRAAMVGALGRIEDIRAIPPLIASLTDVEMTVRRAAANALGVIGDPRAITALALCSAKDVDRSVRCAAVAALDAIKDPATIDPLMQALHDPDAVVRAMAEAAIARRP